MYNICTIYIYIYYIYMYIHIFDHIGIATNEQLVIYDNPYKVVPHSLLSWSITPITWFMVDSGRYI